MDQIDSLFEKKKKTLLDNSALKFQLLVHKQHHSMFQLRCFSAQSGNGGC